MSANGNRFSAFAAPDPDDLVARLEKLLPGFEARANGSTDRVEIRATLRIAAWVNAEMLIVPAGAPSVNEETARRLAAEARRLGIEALGIEQEIKRREKKAHEEGRIAGQTLGLMKGRAEGRREMLAEILAAETGPEGDDK